MTWLVPSALAIAGIAAVVAVALHFIAQSRPLAEPLPTARFIPARTVQARARAIALTDLLLLAVRVGALLAIGLAVAAPVIGGRGRVTRIILVDRSRAVADLAESRDSVRALGGGSVIIPFDSTALVRATVRQLDTLTRSGARGSLSAALVRASRSAAATSTADSVELVLVSPVAREEIDDATMRIRATWPGRIRIVPVAAAPGSAAAPVVSVSAEPNDAVAAGLSLMGVVAADAPVRVVRGLVPAGDSSWARASGHVLVHWPASAAMADDWAPRPSIDAIGGVASRSGTLVARFPRVWLLQGAAVARWSDGTAAAVEQATGSGCMRDVGILIDAAGDVTLRAPFRSFVRALLAPCGGARVTTPAPPATLAAIAGSGPLATTAALGDRSVATSRWTPWLFALGALLLIGELALRRPVRRAA